jgi:ribosomal protein L7/L12
MMQAKIGSCSCCHKPVSSAALSCPHCGHPKPYSALAIDVESLKTQEGTLMALKKVRELTGWGLAEARDYIAKLQ